MTTVMVHKDRLSKASFEWEQRMLKEIRILQDVMIDKEMNKFWFPAKTRFAAQKALDSRPGQWKYLQHLVKDVLRDHHIMQTACYVAEDYISVDIETVHKLFKYDKEMGL